MNAEALLPQIVVSVAAIAVLLAISIRRHHGMALVLTLAGLIGALATLWPTAAGGPYTVGELLVVDRFAVFVTGLILVLSAAVALLGVVHTDDEVEMVGIIDEP